MWNTLLDVYIHDFHEVKTVFWGKEFSRPTNTAHTEEKHKQKISIFHCIWAFHQLTGTQCIMDNLLNSEDAERQREHILMYHLQQISRHLIKFFKVTSIYAALCVHEHTRGGQWMPYWRQFSAGLRWSGAAGSAFTHRAILPALILSFISMPLWCRAEPYNFLDKIQLNWRAGSLSTFTTKTGNTWFTPWTLILVNWTF